MTDRAMIATVRSRLFRPGLRATAGFVCLAFTLTQVEVGWAKANNFQNHAAKNFKLAPASRLPFLRDDFLKHAKNRSNGYEILRDPIERKVLKEAVRSLAQQIYASVPGPIIRVVVVPGSGFWAAKLLELEWKAASFDKAIRFFDLNAPEDAAALAGIKEDLVLLDDFVLEGTAMEMIFQRLKRMSISQDKILPAALLMVEPKRLPPEQFDALSSHGWHSKLIVGKAGPPSIHRIPTWHDIRAFGKGDSTLMAREWLLENGFGEEEIAFFKETGKSGGLEALEAYLKERLLGENGELKRLVGEAREVEQEGRVELETAVVDVTEGAAKATGPSWLERASAMILKISKRHGLKALEPRRKLNIRVQKKPSLKENFDKLLSEDFVQELFRYGIDFAQSMTVPGVMDDTGRVLEVGNPLKRGESLRNRYPSVKEFYFFTLLAVAEPETGFVRFSHSFNDDKLDEDDGRKRDVPSKIRSALDQTVQEANRRKIRFDGLVEARTLMSYSAAPEPLGAASVEEAFQKAGYDHLELMVVWLSNLGENHLSSGEYGDLFRIPRLPQYAIVFPHRQYKGPTDRLEQVKDSLPDLPVGNTVARIGEREIIKRQTGVPAGIPWTSNGLSGDNLDQVYVAHLERTAGMPQSAYDDLARTIVEMNKRGYSFDSTNPNHILVDAEKGRFSLIGIYRGYENRLEQVAWLLLDDIGNNFFMDDRAYAKSSRSSDPKLVELRRIILEKFIQAALKAGLRLGWHGEGSLEYLYSRSGLKGEWPNVRALLANLSPEGRSNAGENAVFGDPDFEDAEVNPIIAAGLQRLRQGEAEKPGLARIIKEHIWVGSRFGSWARAAYWVGSSENSREWAAVIRRLEQVGDQKRTYAIYWSDRIKMIAESLFNDCLQEVQFRFVPTETGLFVGQGKYAAGHYGFGGEPMGHEGRFIYLPVKEDGTSLFSPEEMAVIATHELVHLIFKELKLPQQSAHDGALRVHQEVSRELFGFSNRTIVDDKFNQIKAKLAAGEPAEAYGVASPKPVSPPAKSLDLPAVPAAPVSVPIPPVVSEQRQLDRAA